MKLTRLELAQRRLRQAPHDVLLRKKVVTLLEDQGQQIEAWECVLHGLLLKEGIDPYFDYSPHLPPGSSLRLLFGGWILELHRNGLYHYCHPKEFQDWVTYLCGRGLPPLETTQPTQAHLQQVYDYLPCEWLDEEGVIYRSLEEDHGVRIGKGPEDFYFLMHKNS